MDKRLAISLVIVVAVAVAGCAILNENQKPPSNTTGQDPTQSPDAQYGAATSINPSVGNVYINFRNGTPSRIFLVGTDATFGTFASDHIDQWDWSYGNNGRKDADRGDRFISIKGTIRNDDNQILYIALDANVYDRKGNQIGTLLRSSNRPEFKAAWMGLDSNDSGNFHLLLKCDRQYAIGDIGRYEVVLAWEPGPTPIP